MTIDGILFSCEMEDVLTELQSQMIANHLPYLQKGFKRSGNSLQVQCPFHGNGQERHPSYGIRRSDGMGHCFACECVHSLPEFICACFEKNDITASFGRHWLHKNFMSLEVEERPDVELDLERPGSVMESSNIFHRSKERNSENVIDNRRYVTEEELDSYRFYHLYWKSRGIVDEDIIELFDLGYDPKSKSITFPVRDINGNCLFIARRSVHTKYFNYPCGTKKPVYGLYELNSVGYQEDDDVFICESMIDCLLLWQAGFYALALNGLGNEQQFEQLKNLSVRKFILATDNDPSGRRARTVIRMKIDNKIFSEIVFPDNRKDIGECTQEEIENIFDWEEF